MILPIYIYGSKVLNTAAKEINISETNKDELKQLLDDMFETMYAANGIGLAAPQVGKSVRILIVDGSDLSDTYSYLKDFKKIMINPKVTSESDETATYEEGCLSIPDVHCSIERPKVITVNYFDENLEEKVETFDGFAARMLQHELDHLDGITFTEKAAPIRKKMIRAKLHNISKGKIAAGYKTRLEKE